MIKVGLNNLSLQGGLTQPFISAIYRGEITSSITTGSGPTLGIHQKKDQTIWPIQPKPNRQ